VVVEPREVFVALQARLGRPGTSVLDRLREVRDAGGRVGGGDLERLAGELRWPVAAVTGAASFYADFAGCPRGRRQVRVCEGTSCFATTQRGHVRELEQVLGVRCGERAPDGSVSLQAVRCLGYCYDSPAVLDGGQPASGANLGGLLDSGRGASVGTPPPQIPYASDVDPPVLLAGLLGAEQAWRVWPRVVTGGSSETVIAEIGASGLRGRGGAEFPTAKKWSMARQEPPPRYVVANGDEGDPGSYCDRLLMESDPHRILEGLALAAFATGAQHGLVLVRSEYPAAAARMRAAVAEARADGHLGERVHGSGFDFDVEVIGGGGSYVAGEETALMHAVQGLRGDAHPRPPYPTTRGVLARPTVLNNVETLAAVPWVVGHGGAAYARLGHPDQRGTKLVCLSQLFRRPGVYEVEFGVPLRHLVEDLGGGLRDGHALRAVQIGGPLGGFLTPDQLDLPLLTKPLDQAGAALGHASLIAIDTAMPAQAILRHEWAFGAAESCGACTPCRVGTRRGLELTDRITDPGAAEAALAGQEPLLEVLDVASLCAFGRGVSGAVRSVLRVYSDELRQGRR
jgi:NADH-quinone oxidoreductase subunit F